ncbi:predicted protein, partial [Nematostella vectensis]
TEESNRLRDEVLEKGDIINRLTKTLDDTQRQCQELVRTGTVAEVTSLRSQLRDALGARATAEKSVSSFKNEVTDLQEQLSVYQNALKYGFGGANEAIIKEMEQLRQEQQDYQHKLDKLTHAEQELEEENKNLRQHMAEASRTSLK